MSDRKFAVIIPAAGKAERFAGSENKTFFKIDGRPVFLRSVELFLKRPDVCQIILAVAPSDMAAMKSQYGANLGFLGVKLIEGGARRCDTVAAALKVLPEEAEYVAIHDAARPCATPESINAVFEEVRKTGAAILAAALTGTIKRVAASGVIEATVSREGLYEAQTPQVFRKDVLLKAYSGLSDAAGEITDDAQLVESTGHPVSVVVSDRTNLKITTKSDTALAQAILKARPVKAFERLGAFEEAQW